VSYAPRVSIISKLTNTRTSIVQHLYHEIVKTTMKMILVAVMMIFWVSMMNKLYYGCQFWYVPILFSSNKLLKLKYIHHYFFLKFLTKKSRCTLWARKYSVLYLRNCKAIYIRISELAGKMSIVVVFRAV